MQQAPASISPGTVPFGQSCVILDVRTGVEHAAVSLKQDHHHIPLGDFDAAKFLKDNNIDPARPIYVLCRSGARATTAANAIASTGHANVHVIEGGIVACEASGIPVRKGEVMSLERQVRVAAGFLVMTGVVLGAIASPLFYALSAFVGAGLVFAGVTDRCGMALMLAKAPWNKGLAQKSAQGACPAQAASCPAAPMVACAQAPGLSMPGGTAFYSPANGQSGPVSVYQLAKTGKTAGGCS